MNRRLPAALLAACLISGGCTYLLGKRLQLASSSQAHQTLRYAASSRRVSAGETLRQEDMEWINWPVDAPLLGASTSIEKLAGRVVLYPLEQGQPVLQRYLSEAGSGGGLSSRIPAGMRALALRSDDVVGVAGFLAPGCRLDVLVTYRNERSSQTVTSTVLQNAEVLAAGQRFEPDPSGKPASATVVTLLVDPIEAERAVLASTQGTIHFVLRNGLDTARIEDKPISLSGTTLLSSIDPESFPRLSSTSAQRPNLPVRMDVHRRADSGVETILGGDREEQSKQP